MRVAAAKLLMELMQHGKAVEVLDNLLQEDNEVVEVWYLMGMAHHLLKYVIGFGGYFVSRIGGFTPVAAWKPRMSVFR